MGLSVEQEVVFGGLDRHEVRWRQQYEGDEDWTWSDITAKAKKKIQGANVGDIIEVVFDYNASSYPIVQARLITGSADEKIRALEERVLALEAKLAGRTVEEMRG